MFLLRFSMSRRRFDVLANASALEGLEVLALNENYRDIAAKSSGLVLLFSVERSLSDKLFKKLVQHLKRTNDLIGIKLRVYDGVHEDVFGIWIENNVSLVDRSK